MDSDESAYKEEVDRLALRCEDNDLLLTTNKTKELIMGFHQDQQESSVTGFKFLCMTLCSNLVHQHHFFLSTLSIDHHSSDTLVNFYCCTIERILTNCKLLFVCMGTAQ